MGRYYDGDIKGKFWFAVQDSNCADRFGSTGYTPNFIEYHFDTEHLSGVKEEIQNIEEKLGDKKRVLDEFFNPVNTYLSYTDEMLEAIGISPNDLSEYADLLMGYKIRDCIEDTDECNFTAETY